MNAQSGFEKLTLFINLEIQLTSDSIDLVSKSQ